MRPLPTARLSPSPSSKPVKLLTIINGSPKGKKSISLKYVEYLQTTHPDTEFRIFHVAQEIRSYAAQKDYWEPLMASLRESEGVIWTFPVYVFNVPSALMRFLELVSDYGMEEAFKGLYTCCVSSSIHFYDNLANDYMRGVLEDFGMLYTDYFAADQDDFFKREMRAKLECFYASFQHTVERAMPSIRRFPYHPESSLHYQPGPAPDSLPLAGMKITIIVDAGAGHNLSGMVSRLAACFRGEVNILELDKLNMRGGCLGCMKCAFDNECTYGDKDDIKRSYNTLLDPADIIIYAGRLHHRFFSSAMRLFVERRFMRTHFPFMKGKQVALLVEGPMSASHILYQSFDADVQVSEGNFAGAVSDEFATSAQLDAAIDALALRLFTFASEAYVAPFDFQGVGGHKVFRDAIWGRYRFIFQADHAYYKRNSLYDFPQYDWRSRWRNFWIMLRLRNPRIRRQVRNTLSGYMVKPFFDNLKNL